MSAVLKPASEKSPMLNPISTAELERRWAETRAAMRAAGIEALVVQSKEDWMNGYARWFTDQPATNAYPRSVLFPVEGLMTTCDVGNFGQEATLDGKDPSHRGVGRRVFTPSFNGAVNYCGRYDAELIAKEVRKAACRTVGIVCPDGMYHGFADGLKAFLRDNVKIVDATDLVDGIKAIKSAEEIGEIMRGAEMQDEVMALLAKFIKPGLKEYEVSAYAEYQGKLRGSNQGVFFCISSATRPGMPANRYQQTREIRKGDVVTFLLENNGPGGFYSELARTFVLGKASQELKDALAENLEALEYDLSLMKPGAKCSDIIAAHNEYMLKHGHRDERRILSHGQGYEMVERPLIRHDETMVLKEGMHLALHPHGGVSVTDNYLITESGPGEQLHKTPHRIFELD
jgi:Xaa-Pro aminopeptidase